jgi:4-amino-4-deoxy-L-arabinose transferase-like glycosyltransferase
MSDTPPSRLIPLAWILTAILAALRIGAMISLPLAPDEAYYWNWSRHLDWGYFDHPPLVAWLMALFGGGNEFRVRLGGSLSILAALAFLFAACRALFPGRPRMAAEVVLLANLNILLGAGFIVQTPDSPLILAWSAALFAGSRIVAGGSGRWWYLWGAALGLGLLGKYTMVLLVPCTAAFLLLSPVDRCWLRRREPYLALGLAGLGFLPVVAWNARHQWISFLFQFRHGTTPSKQAAWSRLLEYLGGQAGLATPILFCLLLGYGLVGVFGCRFRSRRDLLFLFLHGWPVLAFFGLTSLSGRVAEGNWPAPAWPAVLLLGWAVYREGFDQRPAHRRWMAAGIGLTAVVTLAVHLHLVVPFLPIAPRRDPIGQFHGWPQLGRYVREIVDGRPPRPGTFILADRGTTGAEAAFYAGGGIETVDFSRPERVTYLDPRGLAGTDAVILIHRSDASPDLEPYRPLFRRVEYLSTHTPVYRGEPLTRFRIHLALGEGFLGLPSREAPPPPR